MGKSQGDRSPSGLLYFHKQFRGTPRPNAKDRMEKRGVRILLVAPRGRAFGRLGGFKMRHHHSAASADSPNHRNHRPFRRLQPLGETTRRVESSLTRGSVAYSRE